MPENVRLISLSSFYGRGGKNGSQYGNSRPKFCGRQRSSCALSKNPITSQTSSLRTQTRRRDAAGDVDFSLSSYYTPGPEKGKGSAMIYRRQRKQYIFAGFLAVIALVNVLFFFILNRPAADGICKPREIDQTAAAAGWSEQTEFYEPAEDQHRSRSIREGQEKSRNEASRPPDLWDIPISFRPWMVWYCALV